VRVVCPEREGPITAFKSRFHSVPEAEKWVQGAGATALTEMGSALKFAAIAEGQADLFVSMSSAKLWDLAAGQVIAEEAGARVLALDTRKPPRHDGASLLAGAFVVLGRRLDATVLDRVEYSPR
jgi:3'(2'), 5'-bisphosphate nucleotidase